MDGLGNGLRLACIGEAMIELSQFDPEAGLASVGVAGDTLNTAIYLKRALPGAEVAFVTALGCDAFSDHMARVMASEGLALDLVARLPDRSPGLYAIAVDAAGERTFNYWRSESAARAMFGPGGIALEALERFDALYLSGITLAILPPSDCTALIAFCAHARIADRTVAFDSNYRPRLWPDEGTARETLAAMWAATTIALPSRDDEARLYPGETVEETFGRIGAPEVVLKDGSAGPRLWMTRSLLLGDYPPASKVVDTTAAGDGFNAGYLAARLLGEGPERAAQAGHTLASRIVGWPGAILPR